MVGSTSYNYAILNNFKNTRAHTCAHAHATGKHAIRHANTYCEIFLFRGHEISWFDDDEHVRGHLPGKFVDFKIKHTTIKLNHWIVIPTKYRKLNVQRIK